MIQLIQQANRDGARLVRACAEAGICLRTYRRWYRDGAVQDDRRPTAARPAPANKLSAAEQEQIVELCNSPAPTTHRASGPCEVWCWDITYCVPGVQSEHGCSNEPRVYLECGTATSGGGAKRPHRLGRWRAGAAVTCGMPAGGCNPLTTGIEARSLSQDDPQGGILKGGRTGTH